MKKIRYFFFYLSLFLILVSCSSKNKTALEQVQPGLAFYSENYIPKSIVSLSPAATEILCTIGGTSQIAARTDFCDYPKTVASIPSVGGFDGQTLSLEKILSFNPDFVYLTKGMHDQFFLTLSEHKIPFYISYADSVAAVLKEIVEVGRLVGHSDEAVTLADSMEKRINSVHEKYANSAPVKVYWEVWNPPFMSAGKDSFINELIETAGGLNIFGDLAQPYPIVSEEAILAANPSVIVISDAVQDGILSVKARVGWQNIYAVKNNQIYSLPTDLFFRPCPRIPDAIERIADILHSD